MVKVVGLADFHRFLEELPAKLEANVLRGALRAGAVVIADEARLLCIDPEVKASIGVSTRSQPGLVTAKVKTSGKGAYRAPWAEYGTEAHFITVDDAQSGGRTVRRVNHLTGEGSLVISGKFVGKTVQHPGERPHPFMRPALDRKLSEAGAAMNSYIRAHITKHGIEAAPTPADEE